MEGEKRKKLLTLGLAEIIFLVVIILVILGVLAFFKVIPTPNFLSFLNPKSSVPTTIVSATSVNIACPVVFSQCRDAVKATYNNQPALLYTLNNGDKLFGMGEITSYTVSSTTLENKRARIIYSSFIEDNKCYSATYIVPDSIMLEDIDELPLKKGAPMATLSGDKLSLINKDFSMLLQLQVKNLNPQQKGQEEYLQCTVLNKQPKDFGTFITPDINKFN